MTEANQKILYEHYKKHSKVGKTEKERVECGKYAAEIAKSFPHFEVKAKEEKPVKETKSNKDK